MNADSRLRSYVDRSRWALPLVNLLRLLVITTATHALGNEAQQATVRAQLAGALLAVADASADRLNELKSAETNTIVLLVEDASAAGQTAIRQAAERVDRAGLALAYWIEVGRCPALAHEHPEWMASLQTHEEWRRFFPNTPTPGAAEVVKTYPWVPILSREPFAAQRARVLKLLADLPVPTAIFLNDLQGAPSACGCGNPLCRWTSDYGNRRSTLPLNDDAAAAFVSAVKQAVRATEVIPVWTTECEAHDGSATGLCAGVGCYTGICWPAFTRQLMPVAQISPKLAVLSLEKEFQRDTTAARAGKANWIEVAIESFATMPPRHQGTAIPGERLIAVLQGWDVSPAELATQRAAAVRAGAQGYVVALVKIDQSWSPQIVPWK